MNCSTTITAMWGSIPMTKTNKAQRQAIKRLYDRSPGINSRMTYKQFRQTAQWGYECIMIRWEGMWLGIEQDGYTHS